MSSLELSRTNPVALDNTKTNTIEELQDNQFENEVAEKGVAVTMISMSNESSQRDESLQHNNSTEETQCLTDDVNESDEAKITKKEKLSDQQFAGDTDTHVDCQDLDVRKNQEGVESLEKGKEKKSKEKGKKSRTRKREGS